MVNGRPLAYGNAPPGLVNGQLMIPVRACAKQINAKVDWHWDIKEAIFNTFGQRVILTAVPTNYALLSNSDQGRAERFSSSPRPLSATAGSGDIVIFNSHAYMPLDQFASALNATSNWDKASGIATLTTNPP
jgi:hypothetical protein